MIEEINMKCPFCSNFLTIDEVYDTESYYDEVIDHSLCYCPKCIKSYNIDIVYKFDHFKIIEECEQ